MKNNPTPLHDLAYPKQVMELERLNCPYYNTTGCPRSKDCMFNSQYFCKCIIKNSEVEKGGE